MLSQRRKSMEPKQFAAMMGNSIPGITLTGPSGPNAALQSIAQARRTSMQFARESQMLLHNEAGAAGAEDFFPCAQLKSARR